MTKKNYFIIGSIFVMLALIFNIVPAYADQPNDLQILTESSWFSTYCIEEDKVHIVCELTIKNNATEDILFQLTANMKDDVEIGLLKNENLKGYCHDLSSDFFRLNQGETKHFTVVFLGDFAGENIKKNRNLPQIDISALR